MAYVRVLRTYRYVDKNPVIDKMRTIVQDEGLMKRLKIAADLAGLAKSTLDGWFHGDIRDPRHSSIMGLVTSLGYEQEFTKARKLNVEKELEFARAWNKREKLKSRRKPKRAGAKTKKRKAA